MRKPSVVVAINPAARRMTKEKSDGLFRFFKENSDLREFFISEKAGDITTVAEKVSKDDSVELFIVAGGDGTMNEAINGISRPETKIGYIPGGTSNVIRFELGISKDIYEAGRTALWGKPKKVRPGIANGRKFLLMTGVGIDADIVQAVSGKLKSFLGKAEYVRTGLMRIVQSSLPPIRVKVEGESIGDFSWVVVSRSSYYAGRLRMVREATLDLEELVAYLYKKGGPLPYLKYSIKTLIGIPFNERDVVKARAGSLSLESSGPVPFQVDGDYAGILPLDVGLSDDVIEINTPG
jgi:YegS/Rv2252/BmrU family lipid kinase